VGVTELWLVWLVWLVWAAVWAVPAWGARASGGGTAYDHCGSHRRAQRPGPGTFPGGRQGVRGGIVPPCVGLMAQALQEHRVSLWPGMMIQRGVWVWACVGVVWCGCVWVCGCVCVCVGAWVCACVLGRAVKLARCSSAACLRRLLCFLVLWDRDVSHVSRAARHVRGRLAETEPEVRV
jgi:hypothetical protein